jgi:hypothetical protein
MHLQGVGSEGGPMARKSAWPIRHDGNQCVKKVMERAAPFATACCNHDTMLIDAQEF